MSCVYLGDQSDFFVIIGDKGFSFILLLFLFLISLPLFGAVTHFEYMMFSIQAMVISKLAKLFTAGLHIKA